MNASTELYHQDLNLSLWIHKLILNERVTVAVNTNLFRWWERSTLWLIAKVPIYQRLLICLLTYLQHGMRFDQYTVLLQVAITGRNFCSSAMHAFGLILRNFLRWAFADVLLDVAETAIMFALFDSLFMCGALSATYLSIFSVKLYCCFIYYCQKGRVA